MTFNAVRQARERATERQVRRLQRRISALEISSNRVSWVRAAIFAGGFIVFFVLDFQVSVFAAWSALVATLLIFTLVVLYHRHLEYWIRTLRISRDIHSDQLARMNLDWDALPSPAPLGSRGKKPPAIDLDLTGPRSLHHLLDTTISRQGSQLLAEWLMQMHPELEQIRARQNIARELAPRSRFRDRFRLAFRLVLQEQLEGENLLHWLTVQFPSRRLRWILPVATLLVAANLTLFGLFSFAGVPPFWVMTLLIYGVLYFLNQTPISIVLDAVVRMDTELDKFGAILKYLETTNLGRGNLADLCAPFRDPHHSPSAQLSRVKLVTFAVGLRSNPLLGILLNLILPWDFLFAYLADRNRARLAQIFPVWTEICYRLDALIALANFGYLNPGYAFPEIVPDAQPILRAENLGHPLIPHDRQVCNDFLIDAPGELAIITGSNMAGKSTFVKTVGINLCLAYAGAPVDATQFRSVPFRLYTCIRITDSIVDGFSYFYAEVKCLKRLLDELKSDNRLPLLYLIDEIFRGTNNRERLLGSRAYIRTLLGENAAGLLATHDLELTSLAASSPMVHNYHFRDHVRDGKLVFDYTIQPGPCPTTNALKIMQMEGLPIESD